ncbi:prepilin peptidase [Patescibacteria group bacterium]|nr:prepilin peptidase [Patescibacteria group bacterium]
MLEHIVVIWYVLLGLIVGSFLNVVIYRFHTGKSLEGRSHCMSCGHTLSWKCLFPVVSYMALRGRCRYCSAHISPRYLMVEVLTGALFGFVAYVIQDPLLRALYLCLAIIFVLISVYDVLHTIIPDEFVIAFSVCAALISGIHYLYAPDTYELLLRVLGGASASLFFYVLWLVSQGRWIGLGDAKLALPLGIIASWPASVSMVVFSFWIGAGISVSLVCLAWVIKRIRTYIESLPYQSRIVRSTEALRKRFHCARMGLTMKSEIPFAPFLLAGFCVAHFLGISVFDVMLSF